MSSSLRSADQQTVSFLDGVAVFWVVLWFVIACLTSYGIWQLSGLSDTAQTSARAVDQAGQALQSLRDVPVVGDTPGELGDEVRAAAEDVRQSADDTRGDVRRLSVLLFLSVFFIPSTPVLGIYLPLRLRRRQERASLGRSLAERGVDAPLESYLAQRAVQNLTFAELLEVTDDPARDLAQGRHAALARVELARLGLDVPPGDGTVRRDADDTATAAGR